EFLLQKYFSLLLPSDLHGGFATSREFQLQKYFSLLLPSDLHGGFATRREFLLRKYFSLLLPSDLHGGFATGETSVQVQNPVYKNASNHLGPNDSPRVTRVPGEIALALSF
ncbi:MAG: hypothetical protein PUI54_10015, partial [Bacteroidales bacterium]|nr:hypothetical protein [Bacteroidales bacterium]